MYHSVDSSGSPISLTADCFERHVRWLAGGTVDVVPLADLPGGDDGGRDAVALTFDDGFANFATEAWPRLAERGLPATVFAVGDHVGKTNAWGGVGDPRVPELPLLDGDALGRLAEAGVEIGAHSRRHPRLPQLAAPALRDELDGARAIIERYTGRPVTSFAYPYGAVDERVADGARQSYARACTTALRPLGASDDTHLLPRLDALYYRDPARLEAWGRAAFRRHLRYLAWRARARRVRDALARFRPPARARP